RDRTAGHLHEIEVTDDVPRLGAGRALEEPRHVGEPFDVGDAGEVKVAAVRLRLAGERLFQVRETLGAPEALACHDSAPPLSLDGGSTAMPAARDAAAVELGAVVEDLEAGARRDAGPHRPVGARRHLRDAAAGDAREAIVRRRVAVEARAGGVRA